MTPLQVLQAAKDLIADKSHWTQGWFARDASGSKTHECDANAACFCALGALGRVTRDCPDVGKCDEAFGWLEKVARDIVPPEDERPALGAVPYVNDVQGHDAVMRMFDRAIELAAEAESPQVGQ